MSRMPVFDAPPAIQSLGPFELAVDTTATAARVRVTPLSAA
jgi:hypothetical protein